LDTCWTFRLFFTFTWISDPVNRLRTYRYKDPLNGCEQLQFLEPVQVVDPSTPLGPSFRVTSRLSQAIALEPK